MFVFVATSVLGILTIGRLSGISMKGHWAGEYNIPKVHDVGDCDVDVQDFGDGL